MVTLEVIISKGVADVDSGSFFEDSGRASPKIQTLYSEPIEKFQIGAGS